VAHSGPEIPCHAEDALKPFYATQRKNYCWPRVAVRAWPLEVPEGIE